MNQPLDLDAIQRRVSSAAPAPWDAESTANALGDLAALLARLRELEAERAPSGPQAATYWLSEYAGTEPTLWTTEAGALDYCTELARDEGIRSWDWITEDDAQQMIYIHPDTDAPLCPGPGRVTPMHPQVEEGPTRPA